MSVKRSQPQSLFQSFVRSESFSGILLVAMAIFSFLWANSQLGHHFFELKEAYVGFVAGDWELKKSLIHWVNDGLMAVFFLFVGLEIKRELITGELSDRRAAMLPIAAAVGGMVVPAVVYAAVNWGGEGIRGWGVPTATDIAFALGILALLGTRAPLSLKVFLTALAIVDDLGAVILIAVFYTENLSLGNLGLSLGVWGTALVYNRAFKGRRLSIYLLLGLFMWYFMLKSGVHATVAGVLLALTIPLSRTMSPRQVKKEMASFFQDGEFEHEEVELDQVEQLVNKAQSPLHELEHTLEAPVAFLIMPVFALFNAGFLLGADASLAAPVSLGAFLGLLAGKVVGVMGACWIAVRLGVSALPKGIGWGSLLGTSLLAGIGFTMSLFIAGLAFGESAMLDQAKLGVLTASVVAALGGLAILWVTLPKAPKGSASA